ncbi:hypothetical protein ACQPZJ_35505 [Actinoplanes sp. CA-054009]
MKTMDAVALVKAAYGTASRLAEAVEATGLERPWVKQTAKAYREMEFSATDLHLAGRGASSALIENVFDQITVHFPEVSGEIGKSEAVPDEAVMKIRRAA